MSAPAGTAGDAVYVVDMARTPIGRFGGGLAGVRPDDLAAAALGALVERHPQVAGDIDDVYFGNANGAGEENRNVARMAVLLAGLPDTTPGATVNRLCASGIEAVISARRAIALGDAELCVAGGVESMTRAPFVVPKPEKAFPHADQTMVSTTLGWRLVNPRMDPAWTVALGEGAEILADLYDIDREAQDRFAVESHHRAHAAWERGRFDREVVKGPWELARDESIRPDTSPEALAKLRPVFRPDGTVTAGNASGINDGAAAVLLAGERACERFDLTPLARVVSSGVSATEPRLFGLGPVESSARALERAGMALGDLSVIEINEAFASQTLACLSHWPDVDPAVVNPNGGAIAIGHPLGCSGARLVGTLAFELADRGGAGLATACIGVGQGLAVVLEAV